jgi:hypothetical protein
VYDLEDPRDRCAGSGQKHREARAGPLAPLRPRNQDTDDRRVDEGASPQVDQYTAPDRPERDAKALVRQEIVLASECDDRRELRRVAIWWMNVDTGSMLTVL